MKKILVPTEFSTCADNALDFAIQTSKLFLSEVTVLHAYEKMGHLYTDYMGANKEYDQSQLTEVYDTLTNLQKRLEESEGIKISTTVCTDSVKCIPLATYDNEIDFIVMGTSGASGLKEKLFGSKTSDIIGKVPVPVIAVPIEYSWKMPQKILILVSKFEKDPVILDFIFELAGWYNAEVQFAVFTDEDDDNASTFMEHKRRIPEYERMLKENYGENTITVTNILGKSFEDSLEDYISKNEIDMVGMITYQRSLPERIFHPSLTRRMSYHTKIPLLAIPANHE